jgi:tetrahydromethanopterin S-methyltransferase subunit G
MSLVSQQKFDELVKNTTSYLQDVFRRLDAIEEKVDALASAPQATTRRSTTKEKVDEQ